MRAQAMGGIYLRLTRERHTSDAVSNEKIRYVYINVKANVKRMVYIKNINIFGWLVFLCGEKSGLVTSKPNMAAPVL